MPSYFRTNNFACWSLNEWLMQPNPWNKKIPEVRPHGARTWGVERQISGSSYDFVRKSLSNLPNFHLSPSYPPPWLLFSQDQHRRCSCVYGLMRCSLRFMFSQHPEWTLLFVPVWGFLGFLPACSVCTSLFPSPQLLLQKETPEGGVMWDSSACWTLKLLWFRWFRLLLRGSKLCREG